MSERTTKKQVERAFQYLCEVMGKEQGYKEGEWSLEYIPEYGGYCVVEATRGSCQHMPFGYRRRRATAFFEWCHALIDGAAMATGKQPYELIRGHKLARIAPLWDDLTDDEYSTLRVLNNMYDSATSLRSMVWALTDGDYVTAATRLYKAWSAGEDDGADKGTIPCLGGRLQEKWQATLNIYKPWES